MTTIPELYKGKKYLANIPGIGNTATEYRQALADRGYDVEVLSVPGLTTITFVELADR